MTIEAPPFTNTFAEEIEIQGRTNVGELDRDFSWIDENNISVSFNRGLNDETLRFNIDADFRSDFLYETFFNQLIGDFRFYPYGALMKYF